MSVTRANSETGECPQGMEACSTATTSENKICYPPEETEEKCPITEMKFMSKENSDSLDKSNYSVV